MTKALQDQLYAKYPKVFAQKDLPMQQTAMCWGLECRDGWYWLIDKLCSNLQFNIDHNNHSGKYPQVQATQVKEKFGGLCFYVDGASDEQHAVISFAESLSYSICEVCGSYEEVTQNKGCWIQTLCKKCWGAEDNKTQN